MSPIDERKIDKDVLLPQALVARKKLQCDPDKWNDYEIEQIRSACGSQWADVSVANVRLGCSNLRKAGLLGTLGNGKNHGKTKTQYEERPDGYDKYLQSAWWKTFRQRILKGWAYKCCWCNSPDQLEVHHRTYVRLGKEQVNDCICLCKGCHIIAHRAKQRGLKTQAAYKSLFG